MTVLPLRLLRAPAAPRSLAEAASARRRRRALDRAVRLFIAGR